MNLFRSERYMTSTAMDIGTGHGYTAAALAVNFGIVLATEIHWDLDYAVSGGELQDRQVEKLEN